MKTKEEIEQLAEKYYSQITLSQRTAFKFGYTQCQKDTSKGLYEFGKLVLDIFHSEGRTHSGKERLPRIKFDEWFNELNKQD